MPNKSVVRNAQYRRSGLPIIQKMTEMSLSKRLQKHRKIYKMVILHKKENVLLLQKKEPLSLKYLSARFMKIMHSASCRMQGIRLLMNNTQKNKMLFQKKSLILKLLLQALKSIASQQTSLYLLLKNMRILRI